MGRSKRTPKTPFERSKRPADTDVFEVEDIKAKRRSKGELQYEIKWVGHTDDDNTWEPLKNLEGAEEKVNAFEKEWEASYAAHSAAEAAAKKARIARQRDSALAEVKALNQIAVAEAIEKRLGKERAVNGRRSYFVLLHQVTIHHLQLPLAKVTPQEALLDQMSTRRTCKRW